MKNSKLSHFKTQMAEFEKDYILIGGNACDLVFESKGQVFRPTEDLDIVLIIENFSDKFALALDNYFKEGGYHGKNYNTSDQNKVGNVYRFTLPQGSSHADALPNEIELFSRAPDGLELFAGSHTTPIETCDGISNFSAILFDDTYYEFLNLNTVKIEDVTVPTHQCLALLKCSAWLGNRELYEEKKITDLASVTKHAIDISRLLSIFSNNDGIEVPERIYNDVKAVCKLLREQTIITELTDQYGQGFVDGLPVPLSDVPDLLEAFFSSAA